MMSFSFTWNGKMSQSTVSSVIPLQNLNFQVFHFFNLDILIGRNRNTVIKKSLLFGSAKYVSDPSVNIILRARNYKENLVSNHYC